VIVSTARSSAEAVRKTSATLGVPLPKPVAAAYRTYNRVTEGTGRIGPKAGALPAAIARCLAAGDDPAADDEVQRLVTAAALVTGTTPSQVTTHALDELAGVLRTHAGALVTGWSAAFDRARTVLQEAADRLGDVSLTDTEAIVRTGGDAAAQWAAATDALRLVDTIRGAWSALRSLTHTPSALTASGVRYQDPRWLALAIADIPAEQFQDKTKPDAWRFVLDGYELRLANFDTFDQAVEAIAEHRRAEQARLEAEANRRPSRTA
jgi:hypothetical protein